MKEGGGVFGDLASLEGEGDDGDVGGRAWVSLTAGIEEGEVDRRGPCWG